MDSKDADRAGGTGEPCDKRSEEKILGEFIVVMRYDPKADSCIEHEAAAETAPDAGPALALR